MGCERQYDKVDGLEVDFRDCGRKDAAAAAKVIIFESEQGALWLVRCVFTKSEEEELGDDNHIALCHEEGVPWRCGVTIYVSENLKGGGLYLIWRRVFLDISPTFKLETDV